ncbi:hypothetical protein H4Q26_015807, partial [Puccinia striiformis f. sp. tritici PST-130]
SGGWNPGAPIDAGSRRAQRYLTRHTIHQPVPVRLGLFTGPMISANRFVVSPGPANPFLRRNPPRRVLQPIPGSPLEPRSVLRFPRFVPGTAHPSWPSRVINVPDDESDTTAGNRPEWIAPLDRRNNAAAERVVPPAPRPRNLETPPTPVSPRGRGFEPSETAANWVHEQVPTLADRPRRAVSPQRAVTPDLPPARVVPDPVTYHELNPIQIHQLLEDPNTPIPMTGLVSVLSRLPTSNSLQLLASSIIAVSTRPSIQLFDVIVLLSSGP